MKNNSKYMKKINRLKKLRPERNALAKCLETTEKENDLFHNGLISLKELGFIDIDVKLMKNNKQQLRIIALNKIGVQKLEELEQKCNHFHIGKGKMSRKQFTDNKHEHKRGQR